MLNVLVKYAARPLIGRMMAKSKRAAPTAQADVLQRRRNNLRAVAGQWGGVTGLAKKLGYEGPSYLSQMIGPKHSRPISERTARSIEHAVGLPTGWLDGAHKELTEVEVDHAPIAISEPLFAQVAAVLQSALNEAGASLSAEKAHAIFTRVYAEAQKSGTVDSELIRDLIALAT